MHLFRELDNWDVSIKHFKDLGDKGFADHMRTKLARESSLTIAEAVQVKQVADQWIKSEQDRAIASHERYLSEPKAFFAVGRDPVRQREHWATVDQAIAQLVAALGSREFSKLDLYTRHMDDRGKASMEAARQHSLAEQKAKQ